MTTSCCVCRADSTKQIFAACWRWSASAELTDVGARVSRTRRDRHAEVHRRACGSHEGSARNRSVERSSVCFHKPAAQSDQSDFFRRQRSVGLREAFRVWRLQRRFRFVMNVLLVSPQTPDINALLGGVNRVSPGPQKRAFAWIEANSLYFPRHITRATNGAGPVEKWRNIK